MGERGLSGRERLRRVKPPRCLPRATRRAPPFHPRLFPLAAIRPCGARAPPHLRTLGDTDMGGSGRVNARRGIEALVFAHLRRATTGSAGWYRPPCCWCSAGRVRTRDRLQGWGVRDIPGIAPVERPPPLGRPPPQLEFSGADAPPDDDPCVDPPALGGPLAPRPPPLQTGASPPVRPFPDLRREFSEADAFFATGERPPHPRSPASPPRGSHPPAMEAPCPSCAHLNRIALTFAEP